VGVLLLGPKPKSVYRNRSVISIPIYRFRARPSPRTRRATNRAEAYYRYEDEPTVVTTADEMDALVDALLAEPFHNSVAALCVRERPLSEAGPQITSWRLLSTLLPFEELRTAAKEFLESTVQDIRLKANHQLVLRGMPSV
jgi:hypothetical protein